MPVDWLDPEEARADPHKRDAEPEFERLTWNPRFLTVAPARCQECGLVKREHINGLYCPEWRLRQLDGDR